MGQTSVLHGDGHSRQKEFFSREIETTQENPNQSFVKILNFLGKCLKLK